MTNAPSESQRTSSESINHLVDQVPQLGKDELRIIRTIYKRRVLSKSLQVSSFQPIIELTGMSRTGKSSVIKTVKDLYGESGLNCRFIEDRSIHKSHNPHYEAGISLHHFLSFATDFLELYESEHNGPIIIERGFYNPIAFLQTWSTRPESELIKFINRYFGSFTTGLLIFNATENNCLARGSTVNQIIPIKQLHQSFSGLDSQISLSRIETSHDLPLMIANIDANPPLIEYQDMAVRTIGTMISAGLTGNIKTPTSY